METNEQASVPTVPEGIDPVTRRFLPGNKLGVHKGSGMGGRRLALAWLDEVLREEGSKRRLKDALREYLDKHPIKFFREIIMPLLPKEAKVEMQAQGQVVWTRIRDSFDVTPEGEVIDVQPEVLEDDSV